MIGVMIVDDERLTRELHRTFVERIEGFEVVAECAGARAAVSAVLEGRAQARIDLILLDMTMPDGHGLDVARHLRARGVTADIIAITGVRDGEIVRQAAALGVVQYLIKPFTFATFQDRMAQYAAHRRRAPRATHVTALPDAPRPSTPGCADTARPAYAEPIPIEGLAVSATDHSHPDHSIPDHVPAPDEATIPELEDDENVAPRPEEEVADALRAEPDVADHSR
ncbi:MAG: two-component system response regulator [Microbacterium sp.]|nr:two-component system response regulator [Microbacterium sp.]